MSLGRGTSQFTVSTTATNAGTTSQTLTLGPLSLAGPSIGLSNLSFSGGKLDVWVSLGVASASLAFGGAQSSSGISVALTNIVGSFEVQVNLAQLGSSFASAFSVPGAFSLSIGTFAATVPNVVDINASGIKISYDPNYNGAAALAANPNTPEHDGVPHQQLLVIQSASITIPALGVNGTIQPTTGSNGTVIPGLTVWDNGFTLGDASLSYGSSYGGHPISLGGMVTFDSLTVGITNFDVAFGTGVTFNGSIYFASNGAHLFDGEPISADLTSSTGGEAFRITLGFNNGRVNSFAFYVDTMVIKIGSYVTFTGHQIYINTGATGSQPVVSVGSIGAAVNAGPLALSGTVSNFEFLSNGTFEALPRLRRLAVGGLGDGLVDGMAVVAADPDQPDRHSVEREHQHRSAELHAHLGASVTGIKGIPGVTISGSVQGAQINIGALIAGQNPLVGLTAISVSIQGNLFGGEIDAGLIGGILNVDAQGNNIPETDTTTPVANRIFFVD